MTNKPLYVLLASALDAKKRCDNLEWFERWDDRISHLVRKHMPSGSGFDSGTTLDEDRSTADRLVFATSFHHMNEAGGYAGWTEHTVTVRPSLIHGFHLTIGGRNRNDIKDYIAEVFGQCLTIHTDYEDCSEFRIDTLSE